MRNAKQAFNFVGVGSYSGQPSNTEVDFLREFRSAGLPNISRIAIGGSAAYLGLLIERGIAGYGPDSLAQVVRVMQILFLLGSAGLIWFWREALVDRYQMIAVAFSLIVIGSFIVLTHAAPQYGYVPVRTVAGFSILMLCLYGFMRLPVVLAGAIGLTATMVISSTVSLKGHDGAVIASFITYMLLVNVAGILLCLSIEKRERQLHAKATLEQILNSRRSELIGSVAHNLRGPLAAVAHQIGNVVSQAQSSFTSEAKNRFLAVQAELDYLSAYLSEVMDVNEAESEAKRSGVVSVPVLTVSDPIRVEGEVLAAVAGVEFCVELSGVDCQNARIQSNRLELIEILRNLVENAIKYCDPNKMERLVKVKFERFKDHVEITVIDNGIGIAANLQPRVWESGYRIRNSLSGTVTGSGFGLAMARARIDAMPGHSISFHSQPGVGTKFVVSVPVSHSQRVLPWRDRKGLKLSQGERLQGTLLCVVSSDLLRRRIASVLEGTDVQARFATDRRTALEHVEESIASFDVIVLELSILDEEGAVGLIQDLRGDQGFNVPAIGLRRWPWLLPAGVLRRQMSDLTLLGSAASDRRLLEEILRSVLISQRRQADALDSID